MKTVALFTFLSAATCMGSAIASTCENSFRTEGDPRNGAEYWASQAIPELSAMDALGQLSAIAANDGFNVLGLTPDNAGGKLTLEQAKGVSRPFLINIEAKNAGSSASVSISTRLNRGVTAKAEDMRRNMCNMLGRIKSGPEGRQLAKQGLAQHNADQPTETTAILLARDLYRIKKQVGEDQAGANIITARFAGKKYLLDGQTYGHLDQGNRVDIWYHTYKEPGFLNSVEDTNSVFWATIACQMRPNQNSRALKLQEHDWAKLEGIVSHYELGSPDKLVLKDCTFR